MNVSEKSLEEIRIHFLYSINVFFNENHADYESMWKKYWRAGQATETISHMRFTCWTTKDTNTHTYIAFISVRNFPIVCVNTKGKTQMFVYHCQHNSSECLLQRQPHPNGVKHSNLLTQVT
jgi:hypothetical protein